jgi:outer membrane receptor protein involved in Fe transport
MHTFLPLLAFLSLLTGDVVDPRGLAVAKARVSLRNAQGQEVAVSQTDENGRFRFESAPSGSFELKVRKPGFSDWSGAVAVRDGETADRRIRLSVSPVRSEVSVTAEPGRVAEEGATAQRTTILTSEELAERSFTTLAEGAAAQVGVAEQRTAPSMGSVFVRGLTGKNVSVYKDSIRYTTSAQRGGVSTFFNLNDAAALESVEMLRGPNGGQFGSDSLGGVVSLLSRKPGYSASGNTLHGSAGTFYQSPNNAFGSSAQGEWSGTRAALFGSIAGRRVNTMRTGDGLDSHAAVTRFLGLPSSLLGERLPDTGFTQYSGMVHGSLQVTPVRHALFHYERSQQDGAKRYDQLLGGDGNLIADLRNLMSDFGYARLQGFSNGPLRQWWAGGSYTAQREERVNQGGQGNPNASISHQYERLRAWGAQGQAEWRQGQHQIVAGSDAYFEQAKAPSFTVRNGAAEPARGRIPDGATYKLYGGFLEDSWRTKDGRLTVNAALRGSGASYRSQASSLWPADEWSGGALSGRAGAVFAPSRSWTLRAHYSRGFRTPNITDLGTLGLQGNGFFETSATDVQDRGATVGDRADILAKSTGVPVGRLDAETSDGIEASAGYRSSRLRIDGTFFFMALGNLIASRTLILPPGATGTELGDQIISRQLDSGAVFVPAATNPVLVRSNYGGARMRGVEQTSEFRITRAVSLRQNWTWSRMWDSESGLPPDIEPGVPPGVVNGSLLYAPESKRVWLEVYATGAWRQGRLSSLALSDRRIGAARSRANITAFFNNGARVRGLTSGGVLLPTGETLPQVISRVLGSQNSAPMFTSIPGYGAFGVRAGVPVGSRSDLMVDVSNLTDRNYRGIGWGVDAAGFGVSVRWKVRL